MGTLKIKKEVIEAWLLHSSYPHTKEELAEHIKVSPTLLSYILNNQRQVTPNIQRKLCEVTGYNLGDLFYYDRSDRQLVNS